MGKKTIYKYVDRSIPLSSNTEIIVGVIFTPVSVNKMATIVSYTHGTFRICTFPLIITPKMSQRAPEKKKKTNRHTSAL